MLSLDDILAAPRDPELLQRHLQNLGYLSPPEATEAAPTIAPMTPPTVEPEVKTMTPPALHDSGHPHLPAMHSQELNEAPVMSKPEVPEFPSASQMVPTMQAPTLSEEQKKALPIMSPGSPSMVPFYQSELEKAIANRPDKMSDHPSFGGKVGHVLGRIGNIALDTFAPGVALNIPGTDLFNRAHEHAAEKNLAEAQEQESQGKLRTAQTDEAEATAAERRAQAAKLGGGANPDLLQDAAGNIAGWRDEKGALHSLDEAGTPQAIKDIAAKWEGKAAARQPHENLEEGLAGAMADEIAKGNPNPTDAPAVKAWGDAISKFKPTKGSDVKTVEDIKQGIAVAMDKGDVAEVKRLQAKLEATDPEGMARLRESQAKAAESAENIRASRADREEKQGLEWVTGEDASGKTVMVPLSQAKGMGLKNMAKAESEHVGKVRAARVVVPMLYNSNPGDPGVIQMINELDKQGKLGPLASRWNDFMSRGWGAGDPLYTALRTRLDLAQTKMMQAHVGNRGGSFMLEHFENLANAGKLDAPTMRAAIDQELRYMKNNSELPSSGGAGGGGGGHAAPKAGDVVGGYRFKGGDPNDQKNYEKVKKQ